MVALSKMSSSHFSPFLMFLLISFALSFVLTQNPPEANLIFAACLLLGGAGILLLSNDRLIKKGNQWLTHRFHEQEINDER
jgi:drug/metabolite transporter (DMT)-like permease